MTQSPRPVAVIPTFVSTALRPLPLLPLQLFLSAVVCRIAQKYPRIFERLGPCAGKRYGLTPTDLPFAFVLDTAPRSPGILVVRTLPRRLDATISGPLRALTGMADGSYDGDALFFSRTIVVEGDIEAVLALRNAVDDAGVDVLHEAAALLGPFGQFGEALFRQHRHGAGASGPVHASEKHKDLSSWN